MFKPGRIRSERWFDIAVLCKGEALTAPAIAKRLGVQSGALKDLIASMAREGLLEHAASDARGQAWKLSRAGAAALRKAETTGAEAALLPTGERLLFIIDQGRAVPVPLLRQIASDPRVRWCARLDGQVRFVVSFGAGDATAVDRAQTILSDAGLQAVVARADEFFDRAQLERHVAALSRASLALPA
jgi:DNA-binding MarR family transcriptional regulator